MKRSSFLSQVVLLVVCSELFAFGQTAASNSIVPRLVRFSGTLADTNGRPLMGTVGITFSLYKESDGGAPLWVETQNVQPDSKGHYTVLLGSSKSEGVTADLFTSGDARWLGVQPQGQVEQPRVLMVSVPYALKAVDAETLGGKPASAFQLASPQPVANNSSAPGLALEGTQSGNTNLDLPIVGEGAPGNIPLWTSLHKIHRSRMFESNGYLQVQEPVQILGTTSTGPLTVSGYSVSQALLVNGNNSSTDTVVTVNEQNGLGISVQGGGEGTGINVVEDSGIGIKVGAYKLGTGIVVNKGSMYGLIANGQAGIAVQGSVPYNNRTSLEAVLGSSWTDNPNCPILSGNDGCAGVVGAEYGSTSDTVGVYGVTASAVGAGIYGRNVSPSAVLGGPPPDPSAGIWGDSSQQVGLLGTSDSNTAVYGLNSTVNDPTSPTAYFENDSSYDSDLVFQTSGFNNPNAGGCSIDTAGDLSCDRTLTAHNISTGSGGGNTDLAGSCTLAGGSCSQPFSLTYTSTPICVATDTTAVNPVQVVVTLTGLTINGTNGDVANYICIGLDSPPPMKIHHGHRRPHRLPVATDNGSMPDSRSR
jgi:hypothetical protein